MKKDGIKLFIVALASFLMLVFCIVAASPDSSLQFIDPTPANYTQEQDFTCGVLAINTHKSIYLPNEAAFIGIAVLDNEGHMICDADVTLTITDPEGKQTVLSTGNGLITISPQCCVYGVTNLPDYYTNYTVDCAGTYVMNLTVTAVTADGTKSITDEFTVQNSVDFDVARDGPTRIYPSVPYVMNFTIKANKNYTGIIREYVPASFVITPQDGLIVTTVGDTKILTWTRNFVKGETFNIYYEFDAPDVSPYLFTLGALEIGKWKEARKWMIASDLSGIIRPDGDTWPLWWRVTGGTGTHASAIDEGVTQPTVGGTSDYVDNRGFAFIMDRYTMGTISGIATEVQVWVYAKCTKKNCPMRINLYWKGGSATGQGIITSSKQCDSILEDLKRGGNVTEQEIITSSKQSATILKDLEQGGSATGQEITTSSTANTWEWASTTYSGLTLGQTELDSLTVLIKGKKGGRKYYVATLYAEVTYTKPTWVSDRESYDSDYHIVYMSGEGFKEKHEYKVAYYDGDDAKVQTEVITTSGPTGALTSQYDFTKNSGAVFGDWHSVVLDGPAPNSYNDAITDANYVIHDGFYVEDSAIPEFPTVIAAIAVCMLCAIPYMVMRRSGGRGDG